MWMSRRTNSVPRHSMLILVGDHNCDFRIFIRLQLIEPPHAQYVQLSGLWICAFRHKHHLAFVVGKANAH